MGRNALARPERGSGTRRANALFKGTERVARATVKIPRTVAAMTRSSSGRARIALFAVRPITAKIVARDVTRAPPLGKTIRGPDRLQTPDEIAAFTASVNAAQHPNRSSRSKRRGSWGGTYPTGRMPRELDFVGGAGHELAFVDEDMGDGIAPIALVFDHSVPEKLGIGTVRHEMCFSPPRKGCLPCC